MRCRYDGVCLLLGWWCLRGCGWFVDVACGFGVSCSFCRALCAVVSGCVRGAGVWVFNLFV